MFRVGCKFALLLVVAGAGCRAKPAPILLDTRGVKPAVNYDALAAVLASAVTAKGRIDGEALKNSAGTLEAQLKLLAVTGPRATPGEFPTDGDVLVYWYNARAAWSMKLLLANRCPKEIAPGDLYDRPFPLDAREMTLRGIDAILAKGADFRGAVAAPGVTTHHARLPKRPFTPQSVRRCVGERFAAFLNDPARFVIDIRKKRIPVPPVLWQFRRRLIQAHHARYGIEGATLATALLPHVTGSPHRRLQDAIGYRLVEARPKMLSTCVEGN
ncbi:MAG TPA: hypothetical protein VM031_05345 [Phycisphaerae bacterium]|nr:hypothetical protein [Phycisphaerae bacterium]